MAVEGISKENKEIIKADEGQELDTFLVPKVEKEK